MISVILATFNGEETLPITLDAFCKLEIPKCGVEFIIVDNASDDKTSSIVKEYCKKLPLKLLYEKKRGKVFAINTGLEASCGELIVLTDDDVVPVKNWLLEFLSAAEQNLDAALFIGQIRPYWLTTPPQWLIQLADEGKSCGCTPLDVPEGKASYHLAKGANILVRKKILQQITLREDLWVAGQDAVGGEDTDLAKKIYDLGFMLWYTPNAMLKHIVRPSEMTVKAVWKRYFRIGRSIAVVHPRLEENQNLLFGYSRWVLTCLFKKSLFATKYILLFNKYRAMKEIINIAVLCGQEYQNRML